MSQQIIVKRDGEFEYPIVWADSFDSLNSHLEGLGLKNRKACVVTDSNVDKLYSDEVCGVLAGTFERVDKFIMQAGEQHKTLDTVKALYEHLIKNNFERKDVLVALGGGVVGDLTGFTAATYLRGIAFIQIPTTLLSQVDSSVGGKTGVDFDSFKNMVGAFWHPHLVYMNMTVLDTLTSEQFACGIGEILKTGLLKDANLFNWTIKHKDQILKHDRDVLADMIRRSCEIKADIVENDPTEQGERALLNLGHTIGHAVEKLKNFELLHGQCVALGYVAAAFLSKRRGNLSTADLAKIEAANAMYGLPNDVAGVSIEEVLKATKSDKKMEQGAIKFVLLNKIGEAVVDKSVTDKELSDAIAYIVK